MELFAPMHILVILLITVLLFGPKKLPEMGRALGEGIREFKKAMKEAANNEENPKAAVKSTETGSEISKQ